MFDDYTAGTWSEEREYQSSLVADGLVSCVQRFDKVDEDRGRALVLATDGEQRGRGIYDLREAGEYAAEHDVVGTDADARGPDLFVVERGTDAVRGRWLVRQTLADPAGHHDWVIEAEVDLADSDELGELVLTTTAMRRL